MKIGFIKQTWHEPSRVIPIVRYRIYDEDSYNSQSNSYWVSPEMEKARVLIDSLGLFGTLYNNIKPEHVQVVIAALRLAGYEVGDLPK